MLSADVSRSLKKWGYKSMLCDLEWGFPARVCTWTWQKHLAIGSLDVESQQGINVHLSNSRLKGGGEDTRKKFSEIAFCTLDFYFH